MQALALVFFTAFLFTFHPAIFSYAGVFSTKTHSIRQISYLAVRIFIYLFIHESEINGLPVAEKNFG